MSHNSSTTPEQMEALLSKYGDKIKSEALTRRQVQELTGLGESASRRLMALANGQSTGRRFLSAPPTRAHLGPRSKPEPEPAEEPERITTEQQGNRLTVEMKTALPNPDDVLRRAGVDLTLWEIEKCTVSAWDMGSVPRRVGNDTDGWTRTSTAPQITPLHSIKVVLKRRTDLLGITQFREDALEEIRTAAAPRNLLAPAPIARSDAGQLLYIGAHDAHVGKFSDARETGQDYSCDLARETALSALTRLLQESEPHGIARIVLPVGHDLMHVESNSNATSAGTPQDTDGRYRIMRRYAYKLMVDMVQLAAQVAPVDVVGVPGNHGRDTDLAIAERLEARFHDHPHVKVQVPLTPRSYYTWGSTLLGLTHGDRIKHDRLPLIMADEMRQAWADAEFCEWLLGHLHAKQTYQVVQTESEHRGVRVRILPSISATDYYHAVCGYSNVRAMEAYRYDRADGYAGHHSVPVRVAER